MPDTAAAPNLADHLTTSERRTVETFLGTLPANLSRADALALAEQEITTSKLSRLAAREIGARLRGTR